MCKYVQIGNKFIVIVISLINICNGLDTNKARADPADSSTKLTRCLAQVTDTKRERLSTETFWRLLFSCTRVSQNSSPMRRSRVED